MPTNAHQKPFILIYSRLKIAPPRWRRQKAKGQLHSIPLQIKRLTFTDALIVYCWPGLANVFIEINKNHGATASSDWTICLGEKSWYRGLWKGESYVNNHQPSVVTPTIWTESENALSCMHLFPWIEIVACVSISDVALNIRAVIRLYLVGVCPHHLDGASHDFPCNRRTLMSTLGHLSMFPSFR